MNVAVVGYSGPIDQSPISEISTICIELGRTLARQGHTIFCGGRDGVMELVSKGVKEVNGNVVGVLPVNEAGNEYLSTRIKTPFDNITRSLVLIESSDVVVSVGGEIGTAIEILIAYARSKPTVLFTGTGGWTDRFSKILIEGKYLDMRKNTVVYKAQSVDQVVEIITEIGRQRR
ncbi:MAG: TIGR00725 family protein [Pseudothermotoga sp.]